MRKNIITMTDSYKFLNNAFLRGVSKVQSYFESRSGALYPTTVFFGLNYLLKEYLVGQVVTLDKLDWAQMLARNHLGSENYINLPMWADIILRHNGVLPIEIRAVPEGTEVEEGNALMICENTDDSEELAGLPNHLETLLTNVQSACTVATRSKYIKRILLKYADDTCDSRDHVRYQLHDFSQRSAKCPEAAAFCGMGHLINFYGSDTVLAWEAAYDYYHGDPKNISYSVFASEHNYMMYRGIDGEARVVGEILDHFPDGVVSVVGDTYDIYNFTTNIVGKQFKERILARDGVFVLRPDSVTSTHSTPSEMCMWIIHQLWKDFGGTTNSKGYKVLDKHVRILYGDSLTEETITNILFSAKLSGFASENFILGCGSYLLDKHNRDTQRFAYKSSAMKIDGNWQGVFKNPVGSNKKSKRGRLKVTKRDGKFVTLSEYDEGYDAVLTDQLVPVFRNGVLLKDWTLDEIRQRNDF